MFIRTAQHKSKFLVGLAGVASLALFTACSAEEPSEEPPADQTTQEQTVQPEESTQEVTPQDDAETSDNAADSSSGDDAVYTIIDLVESEYNGGFIVQIDKDDDNTSQFEVDVVVDNELLELDVTTDGDIRVDERENDDDKIAKASNATVSVTEAIDNALEQHQGATFDQIELDEDDGKLTWEVELDGANGDDIDVDVPATS